MTIWMLAAVLVVGAAAPAPPTVTPAPPTDTPAPPGAPAAPLVERHSSPAGFPSLGPESAKNTLVFFTDYQCPVCPRAARELERLVADFKGVVRVEVHNNPLSMHRNAFDAAAAAKAAQRQGRFWDYHDALLRAPALDRATLINLATGLGLDRERFARDFDDAALRVEVSAEAKSAEAAGARATPGFLINGHVETGWASLPWLEQIVRGHLR
jgi:protein-disulfide isomerase